MQVGDLVMYTSGYIKELRLVERVSGVMAHIIDTKGDKGTWTHVWNLEVVSESRRPGQKKKESKHIYYTLSDIGPKSLS